MMDFDLIYVAYNSSKWIEDCFMSVKDCDYDLKKLHIYIVDNASKDDTVAKLNAMKKKIGSAFGDFEVIDSKENLGFGKGNNVAFAAGKSDVACFINIDTEVHKDTFKKLEAEVKQADEKVAVWEFRQFPYEHPKIYDPLTGEVTWISGAAFAARRSVYEKMGGFDDKIFMYAEDVDLSWRLRANGYMLKYSPKVCINHYSYTEAGEIKPTQYVNSVINNLMLRYRFGERFWIMRWYAQFAAILKRPDVFKGSRKMLVKAYLRAMKDAHYFKHHKITDNKDFKKDISWHFYGFDYETIRDGAFYVNERPKENPLVSIIVRTCGRPAVLRETLISLRNQTYENIEVVVVEDGPNKSEAMIKKEFSDMNILYHSMGKNVGRSKAGNTAMELAHGKYLNFLDDDDLFYADHVEVLVHTLTNSKSNNKAAYALAFETPIKVESKDPYVYSIENYNCIHKQAFDKIMLCHHNYIPIQCIMFEKSLFEQYGGLDETVDALEDWDLWVRYSLHTDFGFVYKTTSIYRVPAVREINEKRQKDLDDALEIMREKHKTYERRLSVSDYAAFFESMRR